MAKSKKKAVPHKAKKLAARKPASPAKKAAKRPSASKAKPKHSGLGRPKAGRARTSNSPAEIFRDNHKPRRLDSFTKGQKEKLLQLRDAMVDSMAGVAQDTLRSRAEGSEASAFGMHPADAGSDASDRDSTPSHRDRGRSNRLQESRFAEKVRDRERENFAAANHRHAGAHAPEDHARNQTQPFCAVDEVMLLPPSPAAEVEMPPRF